MYMVMFGNLCSVIHTYIVKFCYCNFYQEDNYHIAQNSGGVNSARNKDQELVGRFLNIARIFL